MLDDSRDRTRQLSPDEQPTASQATPAAASNGDVLREHLQSALGAAYTIRRELGGGGMSRVFLAHDETLDRDVVVKLLSPELAAGHSTERFARETKLAA